MSLFLSLILILGGDINQRGSRGLMLWQFTWHGVVARSSIASTLARFTVL
ncbi:hypothetical protein [Xanthomonas translucens]|nr:hypothetical protein [Xanthomonas translucens]